MESRWHIAPPSYQGGVWERPASHPVSKAEASREPGQWAPCTQVPRCQGLQAARNSHPGHSAGWLVPQPEGPVTPCRTEETLAGGLASSVSHGCTPSQCTLRSAQQLPMPGWGPPGRSHTADLRLVALDAGWAWRRLGETTCKLRPAVPRCYRDFSSWDWCSAVEHTPQLRQLSRFSAPSVRERPACSELYCGSCFLSLVTGLLFSWVSGGSPGRLFCSLAVVLM